MGPISCLKQDLEHVLTHKPLSLIMLNIDHFKQFNDTFGHKAGDGILQQLAAILQTQCRYSSIDICCRYGGEEFAIIMPELQLSVAAKAAERIRAAVEKHIFSISDQPAGGHDQHGGSGSGWSG